jgi:starch synthase
LKILFAVAEAYPFIKVGGLADVGGALPKALARLGHDVRLLLPGYPSVGTGRPVAALEIPMGPITERVEVRYQGERRGVKVYSVASREYSGKEAIYGGYKDHDVAPFVLFSRAVVALAARADWRPDIIHCNDWHTGLVAWEARRGSFAKELARTGTVLTIHNLAYQGHFGPETEVLVEPDEEEESLLGLGIASADVVNTVSQSYLEEILTPELGMGMDGLLRSRADDLYGILNGVDYEEFDPRTDPHLAARYDGLSEEGKRRNKAALQTRTGLAVDPEAPLLGMVARLVQQKGVDALCASLDALVGLGAQLVVMGTGEEHLQKSLEAAAARHPGAVTYHPTSEEALSRLVYAASDFFLAPSSFEPCGLSPLIALRYGSIPIVRRTGGLADTIRDYTQDPSAGLGFTYVRKYPRHLVKTVRRALEVYRRKEEWQALRERAMAADFSWERSSLQYEELYERAIAARERSRALTASAPVARHGTRRKEGGQDLRPVPLALVHHANQYLITDGYEDRQGISDVVEGYAAALRLHEKYGIPANVHLSGTLIETIAWHCPWFLDLVKDLREKGVVSLIGGTYSENVMPLFPPSFNRRQLEELLWLYEHHLDCRPEELDACWVPERVWDTKGLAPVLTDDGLANGGYRFVLLDDRLLYPANGSYPESPRARFDASGPFADAINAHAPDGLHDPAESCKTYRISGANGLVMVPISANLRYLIPPSSPDHWRGLEGTFEALQEHRDEFDTILVYADDLERTAGVGGWDTRALKRYEGFLRWLASREDVLPVPLSNWLTDHPACEERKVEGGAFFELARSWSAEEDYRGWWESATWSPYREHLVTAQEIVRSAQREGADQRLLKLAWKHLMASAYETAWHDPKEEGVTPAPWAKAVASHARACRVMTDAARWFAR